MNTWWSRNISCVPFSQKLRFAIKGHNFVILIYLWKSVDMSSSWSYSLHYFTFLKLCRTLIKIFVRKYYLWKQYTISVPQPKHLTKIRTNTMILFLYLRKPFYINIKLFEEIPWEFKTPDSMECISQTQIGTFREWNSYFSSCTEDSPVLN